VLEAVAAPIERPDAPPRVPVGAQWTGLARDIRRRIVAEDRLYDAALRRLTAPLRERLRRYPGRCLRQQMLADIVTGWLNLPCRDWRLSCDARLDAKRASVVEVRLVAGTLQREDWDGSEDDLGIQEMHLDVDRARVSLDGRCLATLSLHAIARRLQRHPDGSIESLLHEHRSDRHGRPWRARGGRGLQDSD
jgi:hypothetical protein